MRALGNKYYENEGEGIDLRSVAANMHEFERTYVLNSYANELYEDAIDARQRGWFEQANFLSELAHQLLQGYVVMPGEFAGLESQVYDEHRREEETLNTGLKPKAPYSIN